ncbi:AAA family ATPase [Calidifontibacter sp. DB0510]|uniref:AAA family ATPase n=1 Tax=Metallococcus carri TaxID=1656884 RepID=A0A967B094_9MICO|nr:AAA family ATPase [Metallococcus carri]NHN55687.1 AAA family ATPase [Metallococcus carri]NOP38624.1 AAA family ATPase [Calidifontibacter sp. DB2511S]
MTDDAPQEPSGRLFVISGAQGVGKTTIGRALAEALTKAVFIDGDDIGNLVVSGKVTMTEPPTNDGLEQLFLRYAGALTLAEVYRFAGFDAVIADNVFGAHLEHFLDLAQPSPVHFVMLRASIETIYGRSTRRGGGGAYRDGFTVEQCWEDVEASPRVGLWLDVDNQSVAHTVTQILRRQSEALIAPSGA